MKIQHKRSAVLDNGEAKKPTAAQTEFGELCVNFNEADPALFIRDNADNIVRIGGDLSLYQKKEDVAASTVVCRPDEIDGLSPPAVRGEGTLWWNTEDGVLYVWYKDADSEQWVITVPQTIPEALTQAEADGRYLRVDADAGDQTRVAGEATFAELTTHTSGITSNGEIKVKNDGVGPNFPGVGNNNAGVVLQPKGAAGLSAVYDEATSTVLNLNRGNADGSLVTFRKDGGIEGGISIYDDHWESSGESHHIDDIKIGGTWGVDEKIELSKLGDARFAGITTHEGGIKVAGGPADLNDIVPGFAKDPDAARGLITTFGDLSRTGGRIYANTTRIQDATISGTPTDMVIYDAAIGSGLNMGFTTYLTGALNLTGTVPAFVGYEVDSGGNANIESAIGFKSEVQNVVGKDRWNFFAGGEAPNYFKGTVGVGGTDADPNIELQETGAIVGVSLKTDLVRTQNIDSLNRDNLSVIGFGPTPGSNGVNIAAKTWGVTDESGYNIGLGVSMYQSTSSSARGDVSAVLARPAEAIGITKAGGIYSSFTGLIGHTIATDGFAACFSAPDIKDGDGSSAGKNCGFLSSLTNGNSKNYNFYAEGDAPNFFQGRTKHTGGLEVRWSGTNIPGIDNTEKGGYFEATSAGSTLFASRDSNAAIQINRNGTDGDIIIFRKDGASKGSIIIDDLTIASPQLSDYRVKKDITDLTGAADVIKALRPVTFEYTDRAPGVRVDGFVAHEVEEAIPATCRAVYGTKDATEAIGTLTDWDGTELETEVTEPSAEELTYTEEVEVTPYVDAVEATYDEEGNELTPEVPAVEATYETVTRTKTWTQTGTCDVYQGVDQTKLIPLLTKALQEALARIEALENA